MFEFPNAGEAVMKGYWNNFFQSEDYWNEFFMNYQMTHRNKAIKAVPQLTC